MRSKHRDMLEEIMAEAEKKKLQAQLLFAASENQVEKDPLGPAAFKEPTLPEEPTLADSVRELLYLLVDETTLKAFGWPDTPVDRLLESVIRYFKPFDSSYFFFPLIPIKLVSLLCHTETNTRKRETKSRKQTKCLERFGMLSTPFLIRK